MSSLVIVLCDPTRPEQELPLRYELAPGSLGQRYLEAVRASAGLPLKDPDRFYNQPGSQRDLPWILRELNQRVDIINAWAPGAIRYRAFSTMQQEHLNRMHVDFERGRGALDAPAPLYAGAPPEVQRALEDYNLLIHRFEDRSRNDAATRAGRRPNVRAILSFEDPMPRYPLEEGDYAHFHTRARFGDLALSYCELGKPIWDVLMDQDTHIGDDNIRPLRYYSAAAVLRFGPTPPLHRHLALMALFWSRWQSDAGRRLQRLGFRPLDPRNAIGELRLGTLDRSQTPLAGKSEEEIVGLVGRHAWFKRVEC